MNPRKPPGRWESLIRHLGAKAYSLVRWRDRGALYLRRPWDLERFVSNPDNPALISFPRTGSHWLRCVLELYSGRPLLPRTFFCFDSDRYLLYHTHDFDLSFAGRNVLYLCRDAVATVYSQLVFEGRSMDDRATTTKASRGYGLHLSTWLLKRGTDARITALTYERIKKSPETELTKVCDHLGLAFERERMAGVLARVTRELVGTLTPHDRRVVRFDADYEARRRQFRDQMGSLVYRTVTEVASGLEAIVEEMRQEATQVESHERSPRQEPAEQRRSPAM